MSLAAADLPSEFDATFYREGHPDLMEMSDADLERHWVVHGISEGRVASRAATRRSFTALLLLPASILEIGPLANPIVTGSHVKYFDVLPTDEIRAKAAMHGLDTSRCPEIDYVSRTADLSIVDAVFDAAVSSHAIEHQPDLVRHLQDVGRLLNPGGLYFLAVPDQRYCLDHYLPPSLPSEVLDAYPRQATVHSAASVMNMMALSTHNNPGRHWIGDHGRPAYQDSPELLLQALDAFLASTDAYIDTHAWRFTPASFRELVDLLSTLGVSPFRTARVYDTVRGELEFYAVLEHVPTESGID